MCSGTLCAGLLWSRLSINNFPTGSLVVIKVSVSRITRAKLCIVLSMGNTASKKKEQRKRFNSLPVGIQNRQREAKMLPPVPRDDTSTGTANNNTALWASIVAPATTGHGEHGFGGDDTTHSNAGGDSGCFSSGGGDSGGCSST